MKAAIGIDIEKKKTGICLSDSNGEILSKKTIPTLIDDWNEYFKSAKSSLSSMLERMPTKYEFLGIGISCKDSTHTKNQPHKRFFPECKNISAPFREHFNCPVVFENDITLSVLGEAMYGAGSAHPNALMLSFGKEIEFGYVQYNNIYRGFNRKHPFFGHAIVSDQKTKCHCGYNGCLESIASQKSIEKAAKRLGYTNVDALLKGYKSKDGAAVECVLNIQQAIYNATQIILHSFLPNCIIISDCINDSHFSIVKSSIKEALSSSKLIKTNNIQVVPASLGKNANMLGAASLIFQEMDIF